MPLIERLEDYTSHPWIALVLGVSICMFLVSVLADLFVANGIVAGFFAVYGVVALAIAVFAYLSSQALRLISLRRMKG